MQHKVVLPGNGIGSLDLVVFVQRFVLPHDDEQEGVGCHGCAGREFWKAECAIAMRTITRESKSLI